MLRQGTTELWASGTNDLPIAQAIMQGEGNFVLYDVIGEPVMATGTSGNPGAYAVVEDDGNLAIYDQNNNRIWSRL